MRVFCGRRLLTIEIVNFHGQVRSPHRARVAHGRASVRDAARVRSVRLAGDTLGESYVSSLPRLHISAAPPVLSVVPVHTDFTRRSIRALACFAVRHFPPRHAHGARHDGIEQTNDVAMVAPQPSASVGALSQPAV